MPTAQPRHLASASRDPDRVVGWVADLHEAEQPGHDLPQFMIMSLGENHTKGTTPGEHTPVACVASNDLAVGQIVEAASHSKYWPTMAIFVIEDDSQNGPDHVDAHRTGGLVISPYVKRGVLDSHALHAGEHGPHDGADPGPAAADAVRRGGRAAVQRLRPNDGRDKPYTCRRCEASTWLAKQQASATPGPTASAKMDFDDYDDAPEDELNRILWASVMGPNTPYPTPVHRALFDR